MTSPDENCRLIFRIEHSGVAVPDRMPVQKMTIGSGVGDAVHVGGIAKAFASVVGDSSGGYRIKVNEPGGAIILEGSGAYVSELVLRAGVGFRVGGATFLCLADQAGSATPGTAERKSAQPSPSEKRPDIRLALRGRDREGRSFHLAFDERTFRSGGERLFLGRNRDLCQLHLLHESISRQHAALTIRDGRICIEDLGSNNGTSVNGQEVVPGARPRALESGDRVRFGEVELLFDILSGSAA